MKTLITLPFEVEGKGKTNIAVNEQYSETSYNVRINCTPIKWEDIQHKVGDEVELLLHSL